MAKYLVLFILSFNMFALEDPPVNDGSSTGGEFREQSLLPRALGSDHNFTAFVPTVQHGLVISNPGMERIALNLIGIKTDGTQTRKFVMVDAGETKHLSAEKLAFAHELHILSLQLFEVTVGSTRSTQKPIRVRQPTDQLLSFLIVGEDGSRVTVAKDDGNTVYFPAYPYRVGTWHKDEQAVIQDDGTVLQRIR